MEKFLGRAVFDAQSPDEEAEDVSVLIDQLGRGFAAAVACLGLHHNHQGVGLQTASRSNKTNYSKLLLSAEVKSYRVCSTRML